jgi:UDP-N-acetylglucosamine 1-carboxyvinyltransferase
VGKSYTDVSKAAEPNNILLACAAEGTSVISGVALEPEVQSFMHFLNALGGNIEGIGGDCIIVQGGAKLGGVEFMIIPDRLEAMTFAMFVGAAGGEVIIQGFDPTTLGDESRVLGRIGLEFEKEADGLRIYCQKLSRLRPMNVNVGRYPLFYTDLQPILVALLGLADGESKVTEKLYGSNRFQYVSQLQNMGANIGVHNDTAVISGILNYKGARVWATDIRAGAALVLAALAAEGTSYVYDIHHIDQMKTLNINSFG